MNPATIDEEFWEDLLDAIDQGKVIPIVGPGAVTRGEDEQALYPWMARRLAEQLGLVPGEGAEPTLADVATAHMLKGGDPKTLYTKINRMLKNEPSQPGQALRDLASIKKFNLYLTATFDPLLQRALDDVRHDGQPEAVVHIYSPLLKIEDLPAESHELQGTHVFHLLGRHSSSPEYAITDEDYLEFILGLKDGMQRNLERLARALKKNNLLFVGLHLSDWLARFFLRMAKQERLSATHEYRSYLADGPSGQIPTSLAVFFRSISRDIHVVQQDPPAFCAELARRWRLRHPAGAGAVPPRPAQLPPMPREMPRGAIFVSYAREDEVATITLVRALQVAGCDVWYDRERLVGGQNWRNELELAVKKHCGLFISVISATTARAREGYYVRERKWAAERAEGIKQGEEFYLPVVIDDTPNSATGDGKEFAQVQTFRAPGGAIPPEYAARVLEYQRRALAAPK